MRRLVYKMHIVYAESDVTTESFNPAHTILKVVGKRAALDFLNSDDMLRFAVMNHAQITGRNPDAAFIRAVYVDTPTCDALGLQNDEDLNGIEHVEDMLRHRFEVRKQAMRGDFNDSF